MMTYLALKELRLGIVTFSLTTQSYFLEFRHFIKKFININSAGKYFGHPAGNYMFKVNKRNTRTRCEIYSKLTIKTPERRHGAFIVNFGHTSQLGLVFLLVSLL